MSWWGWMILGAGTIVALGLSAARWRAKDFGLIGEELEATVRRIKLEVERNETDADVARSRRDSSDRVDEFLRPRR
jgi:hypothetical protein